MTALEDAWDFQESWAERDEEDALCLLDLRRRVEALEQRALTAPESSADQRRLNNPVQIAECGGPCSEGGPAACDCGALAEPAPAAPPLWREVRDAMQAVPGEIDWVAAQLAVADWLAARGCAGSADLLRAESRQVRKEA